MAKTKLFALVVACIALSLSWALLDASDYCPTVEVYRTDSCAIVYSDTTAGWNPSTEKNVFQFKTDNEVVAKIRYNKANGLDYEWTVVESDGAFRQCHEFSVGALVQSTAYIWQYYCITQCRNLPVSESWVRAKADTTDASGHFTGTLIVDCE